MKFILLLLCDRIYRMKFSNFMCKSVYSVKGCSKRFPDLPNEILLHRYSSFDLIGIVLINWINDEMVGMSPSFGSDLQKPAF